MTDRHFLAIAIVVASIMAAVILKPLVPRIAVFDEVRFYPGVICERVVRR